MIDVLVAGGGPVGLTTAICCARAGMSVMVAEPRGAPIDKACGEGVMPAAVRRLATLGVTPDGYPLRGIRYVDATHQADARFRHGDGLGVRRTVLHAALAARAAALGIPVLPVKVTTFTQDARHVTAAGVEARYLVAADGLHSTIRRTLERDAHAAGDGARGQARPGARTAAPPRYGLRQHYRVAPWTDLVEVHWTPDAEAYVTPVSADVVGVALLFAKRNRVVSLPQAAHRDMPTQARPRHKDPADTAATAGRAQDDAVPPHADPGFSGGTRENGGADDVDFKLRLAAFPALLDRLAGAARASELRGAGPMRQDVRCRVHGRVLLVGDASGYVDALTGEGLGVGLAQADALAACLAADRPADYERAWRRASGPAWRFTAGLLWSRNQPLLGPRLVPFAQRFPRTFTTLVNHVAEA
jgi:flavin-dependent dehydrogenase